MRASRSSHSTESKGWTPGCVNIRRIVRASPARCAPGDGRRLRRTVSSMPAIPLRGVNYLGDYPRPRMDRSFACRVPYGRTKETDSHQETGSRREVREPAVWAVRRARAQFAASASAAQRPTRSQSREVLPGAAGAPAGLASRRVPERASIGSQAEAAHRWRETAREIASRPARMRQQQHRSRARRWRRCGGRALERRSRLGRRARRVGGASCGVIGWAGGRRRGATTVLVGIAVGTGVVRARARCAAGGVTAGDRPGLGGLLAGAVAAGARLQRALQRGRVVGRVLLEVGGDRLSTSAQLLGRVLAGVDPAVCGVVAEDLAGDRHPWQRAAGRGDTASSSRPARRGRATACGERAHKATGRDRQLRPRRRWHGCTGLSGHSSTAADGRRPSPPKALLVALGSRPAFAAASRDGATRLPAEEPRSARDRRDRGLRLAPSGFTAAALRLAASPLAWAGVGLLTGIRRLDRGLDDLERHARPLVDGAQPRHRLRARARARDRARSVAATRP